MSETREIKIKRLLYQTWYRGCKETDRILGTFAKENIHNFSDDEIARLEEIMLEDDKDIFNWLTEKEPLPEKYKNHDIMAKLMEFDFPSSNV